MLTLKVKPSGYHLYSFSLVYNSFVSSVALCELTCPSDSEHEQHSICRKQNKTEYLKFLAELHHLQISNYYKAVEI